MSLNLYENLKMVPHPENPRVSQSRFGISLQIRLLFLGQGYALGCGKCQKGFIFGEDGKLWSFYDDGTLIEATLNELIDGKDEDWYRYINTPFFKDFDK